MRVFNSDNCYYVIALEINETAPTPPLAEPRTPSAEEQLEAVQISILYDSTVSIFFLVLIVSNCVPFFKRFNARKNIHMPVRLQGSPVI